MRGSVKQRSKGSWHLRVDGPPDPTTGARTYITKTVRGTKREAEAELVRLLTQATTALPVAHASLADLVERWLTATEAHRAPKTMEDRRRLWRLHVKPALGHLPLAKVGPAELDALYARLRDAGHASTSIACHAMLSGAFSQAVKWGWLPANPAARATPGKPPETEIRVPAADELRASLAALDLLDADAATLVRLGALTGMRRGELCALRWTDVDLDGGALNVARAMSVADRVLHERPTTKTGEPRRIAIGPGAVAMLRAHRTSVAARLLELGIKAPAGSWVFPADHTLEQPIHPELVTRRWTQARTSPTIRLHDLRHHSATVLIAAGHDLPTVMSRHGWRTLRTAQRYIHAVESKDRDAAAALELALGG